MDDDHSVLMGTLYMLGLSLLLSWVPAVGPFVAGFVGGRKAGSPGRGLLAALLPALVAAGVVWFAAEVLSGAAEVLAVIFGAALVVWILVSMAMIFLGAFVGGWTAERGEYATRTRSRAA